MVGWGDHVVYWPDHNCKGGKRVLRCYYGRKVPNDNSDKYAVESSHALIHLSFYHILATDRSAELPHRRLATRSQLCGGHFQIWKEL